MADSTIRSIQMLSHAMTRRSMTTAPKNVYSSAEGRVLAYLFEHYRQEIYQKDIEAEFNIRPATASGLLNNMEHKGLITRTKSRHDARRKAIHLSDGASHYRPTVANEEKTMERTLTKGISDQELSIFNNIVRKMISNLSNQ